MKQVPGYLQIAQQIKDDWLGMGASPGDKLPTQDALARRFGVNRSTVVRAVNTLIAEGCVVARQGSGIYVADTSAQTPSAPFIGLIVPRLHAPVIVQTCLGVEQRARQLGYRVMLSCSDYSLELECALAEQHLREGARGVVMYPVTRRKADLTGDYLMRWTRPEPVVTVDIVCEEWPCSQVVFDNRRLGYDMTRLLLRHDHRRIAFMHTASDSLHTSIQERRRGWEDALREAGIEVPPSYCGWPLEVADFGSVVPLADDDYRRIAAGILSLAPRPDAVIAWNDDTAAHVIQALVSAGAHVPDDIRVVGFDCESHVSRLFRPLFPTSRPDFVRLGELAVDVLHRTACGETTLPRTYYYPVPVLWRDGRRNVSLGDSDLLRLGSTAAV